MALRWLVLPEKGRAWLEATAGEALDTRLTIRGPLRPLVFSLRPGIAAQDVSLSPLPTHSGVPEVHARQLSVQFGLWDLLQGEVSVKRVQARDAEVTFATNDEPALTPRAVGALLASILADLPPDILLRDVRLLAAGRGPEPQLSIEAAAWRGCGGKLQLRGKWGGLPLEFSATPLCEEAGRVELEDLRLTLGESDLEGQLALDLRLAPVKLSATLHAQTLRSVDLPSNSKAPAKGLTPEHSEPIRPDLEAPISLALLQDLDLDVSLTADRLQLAGHDFSQLRTRLTSKKQSARLHLESLQFWKGDIKGTLSVNAAVTPAALDLALRVDNMDLSIPFQGEGGSSDASLTLAAKGNTLSQAVASSRGNFRFVMDEARLHGDPLGPLGQNLLTMFFSGLKPKQAGTVLCTVVRSEIEDGVGRTQVVLDTPQTVIAGIGKIDLPHRSLDILLQPSSHSLSIGRVKTPIRVSGKFGDLKVSIDVAKVTKQFGEAGLLFLANPLLAVVPFIELGSGSDACQTTLSSERIKTMGGGSVVDHAERAATQTFRKLLGMVPLPAVASPEKSVPAK
ncbi:MAG: AsmA family protein [Myxococcota bacterium]